MSGLFGMIASTVRREVSDNGRIPKCDDDGRFEVVTAAGGATQDVNLVEVAGDAVLNGGIAGAQSIGGTNADGDVDDGSWPVKIGAVVKDILTLLTVGDVTNLFADVYGRLHVRPAGFDATEDAERSVCTNQPRRIETTHRSPSRT
jgi:hypothetical protein